MDEKENIINGHEYVDLGLSVLWATCNVGAEKPEDYGDYYAWGETETKALYYPGNSETSGFKIQDIGNTFRDVAHVKWGGRWRMPTKDEFDELIDNCEWEGTTRKTSGGFDVMGYKVTGKNGNSIFLPEAGYKYRTQVKQYNERGSYWSSTPNGDSTTEARYLYFYHREDHQGYAIGRQDRCYGMTIRAVAEK